MEELRPGLRRWTAPHPDWTPDEGGPEGWEQEVGCVRYEGGDALVLIDPLAPPARSIEAGRFWAALDRDVERMSGAVDVLLTVYYHARSAPEILGRYGRARVWFDERSAAKVAERVPGATPFRIGEALPGGIDALDAGRFGEVLFWLPDHRALVAGDVILGGEGGELRPCPDSWLPDDVDPRAFRGGLRSLLALPVELVLVSHGQPVLRDGRAALARALAPSP